MRVQDIDIVGTSVSGFATAIALPQFKICFDCGVSTPDVQRCDTILITHGHIDHFGALAAHAHTREMVSGGVPTYITPAPLVKEVVAMMDMWGRIQGQHPAPHVTSRLNEGESFCMGKRLIRSFKTDHRGGDSQGYIVYDVRKALKAEYRGLPGQELGRLRKEGTQIEDVKEVPLVAFTGDTRATIFDDKEHPALKAKVLIVECTYLDDVGEDKAEQWGHIHISQLRQLAEQGTFDNVEALVLCHFSQRYDNSMIEEALKDFPHSEVHYLPMGG